MEGFNRHNVTVSPVHLVIINALCRIMFNLCDLCIPFTVKPVHFIEPDHGIKLCVVNVLPFRDDLKGSEPFELEFTLFIIIAVQPPNAAIQAVFAHAFQLPHERFVKEPRQRFRVKVIIGINPERLTKQIVGFLLHHPLIHVINQFGVRKVLHFHKVAVITNGGSGLLQDVMPPTVIVITGQHPFPFFGLLHTPDFVFNESFISQGLSPFLNDPDRPVLHSIIKKHVFITPNVFYITVKPKTA